MMLCFTVILYCMYVLLACLFVAYILLWLDLACFVCFFVCLLVFVIILLSYYLSADGECTYCYLLYPLLFAASINNNGKQIAALDMRCDLLLIISTNSL